MDISMSYLESCPLLLWWFALKTSENFIIGDVYHILFFQKSSILFVLIVKGLRCPQIMSRIIRRKLSPTFLLGHVWFIFICVKQSRAAERTIKVVWLMYGLLFSTGTHGTVLEKTVLCWSQKLLSWMRIITSWKMRYYTHILCIKCIVQWSCTDDVPVLHKRPRYIKLGTICNTEERAAQKMQCVLHKCPKHDFKNGLYFVQKPFSGT